MAISDILGDLEPAVILHLLSNSSYVFSFVLEKLTGIDGAWHLL
jgi:hypothetical protein